MQQDDAGSATSLKTETEAGLLSLLLVRPCGILRGSVPTLRQRRLAQQGRLVDSGRLVCQRLRQRPVPLVEADSL